MADATATTIEFPDGVDDEGAPLTRSQYAVQVTSPVRLDQLDHEITSEFGWRKQAGISAYGDPAAASEEEPVTLYVDGRTDEVSDEDFLRLVRDHTPDPEWNTPGHTAAPDPTFEEAKERVLGTGTLHHADLRAVLRGLLTE